MFNHPKLSDPLFLEVPDVWDMLKIMLSAVWSLAPHSQFAEEARPHLCMDEPKRPTPVRRRLSLTQAVLVKLIPIDLVLTIDM